MYKDTIADLYLSEFIEQEPNISDGSDPDNSSSRPTKKSSSKSYCSLLILNIFSTLNL